MPNLPPNLVKPVAFDSPLRRTPSEAATSREHRSGEGDGTLLPFTSHPGGSATQEAPIAIAVEQLDSTVPPARTKKSRAVAPAPQPIATLLTVELEDRITVRIGEEIRRALENECHRRRIAGVKTNVAEIAREVLRQWASAAAPGER